MDELIKESILFFKARALNISVNKGRRENINITDWTENCIKGKSNYSEVLLQDGLSSVLM